MARVWHKSLYLCTIVTPPGVTHEKQNCEHTLGGNDMNSVCLW